MAATTPMPAAAAFCTISKPIRPLTPSRATAVGSPAEQARAHHLVDGVVPADVLAQRQQGPVAGRRALPHAGHRCGRRPAELRACARGGPGAPPRETGAERCSPVRRRSPGRGRRRCCGCRRPRTPTRTAVTVSGGPRPRAGERTPRATVTTLRRSSAESRASVQYATASRASGGEQPLGMQQAGRKLEVVAGGAHGHPDASVAGSGPGQPDLQRLLGGEPVLPLPSYAGGVLLDADADGRSGASGWTARGQPMPTCRHVRR